jgi:tRNA-dihydrouridine synthase 2
MRPRERAIRHQLKMIGPICKESGVACLMNGDVTSRSEGLKLAEEYGVDGAMIATEAEKNPSCFRPESKGGPLEWKTNWAEAVTEYMRFALQVENRWGNTKYLLGQMIPGKSEAYTKMNRSKCYKDVLEALGLQDTDDLLERAKAVDRRLGIPPQESRANKRARVKEAKNPEPIKAKTEKRAADPSEENATKRPKQSDQQVDPPPVINQELVAQTTLSV